MAGRLLAWLCLAMWCMIAASMQNSDRAPAPQAPRRNGTDDDANPPPKKTKKRDRKDWSCGSYQQAHVLKHRDRIMKMTSAQICTDLFGAGPPGRGWWIDAQDPTMSMSNTRRLRPNSYYLHPYGCWLPEAYYGQRPPCPNCETATGVGKGWFEAGTGPRMVIFRDHIGWLDSKRYECTTCSSKFWGHDPKSVALLGPGARSCFNIFVGKRYLVDREVVRFINTNWVTLGTAPLVTEIRDAHRDKFLSTLETNLAFQAEAEEAQRATAADAGTLNAVVPRPLSALRVTRTKVQGYNVAFRRRKEKVFWESRRVVKKVVKRAS